MLVRSSPLSLFRCFRTVALLALAAPLAHASGEAAKVAAPRRIALSVEITVPGIPQGAGPIDVFVPIPVNDERQGIESYSVRSGVPGRVARDARGNRFWRGRVATAPELPMEVTLDAVVQRRAALAGAAAAGVDAGASARALFLPESDGIAVAPALLDPIVAAARARAASLEPLALARATFAWLDAEIARAEGAAGACAGDATRTAKERKGSAGDVDALAVAVLRALEVPARVAVGIRVPVGEQRGETRDAASWVEVFAPDAGWIAVDARPTAGRARAFVAEAFDRIHVTLGCDLRLGDGHADERAIEAFAAPYVEVAGRRFDGEIETRFLYTDLAAVETLGRD